MNSELSPRAKSVQKVLQEHGFDFEVQELPDSTRSAQDAAEAIACSIPQIAKSIIFKTSETEDPILVIASGSNRVDIKKVGRHLNQSLKNADADYVKDKTGFSIGGVSPVGLKVKAITFIDEDLLEFDTVWAAAGTPNAVFKLNTDALPELTKGKVIDLKE